MESCIVYLVKECYISREKV